MKASFIIRNEWIFCHRVMAEKFDTYFADIAHNLIEDNPISAFLQKQAKLQAKFLLWRFCGSPCRIYKYFS